ncbi:23S rRNA (guanosine2251-2'-O)-methyltransferase [Agrococcus baldri]|uniref:23S rRNA (Guanosine2251-2'-O)-methyltransferase n=1 Tax=Agrococcus baldri TaxID=153730 RepID=A0AA94HKP2_9MICO|nr:23S rRNA (guanosine(2251)-2'-O)-methyltransferase RlmB [Agrococcus baldri]SFS01265.1 23S rRNA (guanosine2251-2'-O)-methyltransferase [Agrococcus baldri]
MNKPQRPARKKGPQKGTGGNGRKSLEGKGPTPKAEDRSWHPAGKRKAARERYEAVAGKSRRPEPPRHRKPSSAKDDSELVTGRNSVLEALKAKIPATSLILASRLEMDDRVKEILSLATKRGVPVLEVMRPELDRISGHDTVHQGVALKVPPYQYAHPIDLLETVRGRGQNPLFIALDGVTDPRNLGAIIRSAAAFGAQGVIVPQRRSVGVTASAWKTSAGAAARVPVAMASNLTATLKELKGEGMFVIGLDGDGDVPLHRLELADGPLVVVVGSEGKGISRLVAETCDAIVSIPIESMTESLNAGIAASVTLYEVAKIRSAR